MTNFDTARYERMVYRRCGKSGLQLPALSLGGWHNFTDETTVRGFMRRAFDLGVTHFDLANNYGPPPGRAEEVVGRVLATDFKAHRDELVISTKAGYGMWPGPYGEWGSRKYLVASLDQSLRRLGLEYVDVFYSHRFDPSTPLEETMGALDHTVRRGKALYVGVSNYDRQQSEDAARILRELGTPLTLHQPSYSMLNRAPERQVLPVARDAGFGVIAFCPLAQGLLTDRYLQGIPQDSRAAGSSEFLSREAITPALVSKLQALAQVAAERGQTLAQMALSWVLRFPEVTSVLCGVSRISQLEQNVQAVQAPPLSQAELQQIESALDANLGGA
jgi:L-glyceraldehyde 3-phosphate reductase